MADSPISDLPVFDHIHTNEILPSLERILKNNREKLAKLIQQSKFTWDNLLRPLELMSEDLQSMWAPIEQLNATMNSPELRAVYNQCLPLLTAYHTELSQNEDLYRAIKSIATRSDFAHLDPVQQQIIQHDLRDFKLSGIGLPEEKKKRFAELQQRYAELTTKFEENLLDAQNSWFHQCKTKKELGGLPEWLVQIAKENAKQRKLSGWVLTLDAPTYFAVMAHADNPRLREQFYRAYCTRASDQAENKKWDNSQVMLDILQVRYETAQLLGFNNYAELSLATKMAETPEQVLSFLNDLGKHAKPYAEQELLALEHFTFDGEDTSDLNPWDIAYYSEKLQQKCYSVSQEQLRPYFPENKVWQGLSEIVHRLYGIQVKRVDHPSVWHPDVRCYAVCNEAGTTLGYFYTDLYARPNKRGGAWVGECRNRYIRADGQLQLPVAFLNCNFTAPSSGNPCLMTHDEVVTLFHEFGHSLHHLLTKIDFSWASGMRGVEWDAVELPSQFMENWCWRAEVIPLISSHYKTGKPLPTDMLDKLLSTKNFQIGLQMVRQLEFALFDFRLHKEYQPGHADQIQAILNDVREHVAVIHPPSFNRFQHGFSHIFAGGYAAGYYSYKWAEVLASDAFARFEEEGIFNTRTGHDFLKCILEKGSSANAMILFKAFRGREPQIKHLLKHSGMLE